MLVIAWCAHVGSSLASSPPSTRRAALRAAAARLFIFNAEAKVRMRGSMASAMPTSRRSAAVLRSESLNASASPLPSHCRRHRGGRAAGRGTRVGLQRLGAFKDVAVAVVGLEQLRADLELVRLVQRRADFLDVRLAGDVEQLLLKVHHLAIDDPVRHLAAVGRQLDAGEAREG
eukprot:1485839-Pleurochrysis_carterae.AAC.1